MGLKRALGRLAAVAPPRVFVVAGRGGAAAAAALRADPRLAFVDSPRSADVLLAVGGPASGLLRPATAVHDQLARPRATVWWTLGAEPRRLANRFPGLELVEGGRDPAEAVLRVHAALQTGARASDPEVLPDREPAPWRGVGPYGQGGTGMTGGVPYGRPMTGRAPDRDGLELDQLPVRLGPFLPPLPPGLVLDVKLQGDVLQEVEVAPNPFRRAPVRARRPDAAPEDPFEAVRVRPVSLEVLERARARHLLLWLGGVLHLHGLPAWARRSFHLARELEHAAAPGAAAAFRGLLSRLDGRRPPGPTLRWAMRGLGSIEPAALAGRGLGPVARAAGLAEDARAETGAYRALDFATRTTPGGDAWARFRQRLDEIRQALELSARAGDATVGPLAAVEGPRGRLAADAEPPSRALLELVPDLLRGREWGDAMTIVASLDLDVEEAARAPRREAGEP